MSQQVIPLHPSQYDIFMDQLIDLESPHYNTGGYFRLRGRLDKELFKTAVRSLPQVFDVFKMRFDAAAGEPRMYLDETYTETQLEELLFDVTENRAAHIEQWVKEQMRRPFPINKDTPLFDHGLITIHDTEYWYYVNYHHLLTDGYGIAGIIQYLAKKYTALLQEEQTAFNYVSYQEEATKANAYYHSTAYEEEGNYWKQKINHKPATLLEQRYFNEQTPAKRSDAVVITVTEEERAMLDTLQQKTNAGLPQLTIAALMIYYGTTTGVDEFVFGTPLHRRRTKQSRSIAGMYTGVIPFKGIYQPQNTLQELIRQIIATQREDYRYQNYLIGDLSRHFKVNGANDSLLQIVVNYASLNFELDFGTEVQATSINVPFNYLPFPLEFMWNDYGRQQHLQLRIGYQLRYFERAEVLLLSQRIMYILQQFSERLEQPLADFSIIPAAEQTLLQQFNHTTVKWPAATIPALFKAQVQRTPAAIAVQDTSFSELDLASDRLAAYLQSQGVTRGALVPLCTERSLEMIIGILGILKAGAAYVPVDPSLPLERIRYMLEDTAARVVVTTDAYIDILPVMDIVVNLSHPLPDVKAKPVKVLPTDAAYVIYTSGSTGRPKGVINEHKGIVNRLRWIQETISLDQTDALLQKTTFSFDVSAGEIFWPLISGARLVLAAPGGQKDAGYLKQIIDTEQISTIHFVPSMLNAFLDNLATGECTSLKRVLCSGEALLPGQVNLLQEKLPGVSLYNLYGPTEAAIEVSYWQAPASPVTIVPIGKPIANTQLHVLNAAGQPQPIGVPGELYIGGVQVARGYLNLPELTAEKFVNGLYKTGDLASWMPDGNITYLGRIDDQVKIRGYRIELGEITNVLLSHPWIKAAVVVAVQQKLVAYVVPEETFDKEAMLQYLQLFLPDYMTPALFITLDALPLTPSGKVDKKALPAYADTISRSQTYVAPRTSIEHLLAGIWQELLGQTAIGVHDNFFELGGDSIIVIQVVSRLRRVGYTLQPRDVFSQHTIARLAILLSAQTEAAAKGEQGLLTGNAGLLPMQQWYLSIHGPKTFYHQAILSVDKTVSAFKLSAALAALLRRHDVLRARFTAGEQTYGLADVELELTEQHEKTYALNIEQGILFRAVLEKPTYRLLVVIHHLAVDGISWRIILEDLAVLLREETLSAKSFSTRQWHHTLLQYGRSARAQTQLDHWRKLTVIQLPLRVDKTYVAPLTWADTALYELRLPQGRLLDAATAYNTEINDLLLLALAFTLRAWNNNPSIILGLEGHGREDIAPDADISNTAGWFTSLFPVLLELPANTTIPAAIKSVKEQLRRTPDKGIGYGVLKYLTHALQQTDPWEVVFNYLGQVDQLLPENELLQVVSLPKAMMSPDEVLDYKLSIDSLLKNDQLLVQWRYSTRHFNANTIHQLAADYNAHLQSIITHCTTQQTTQVTPSDFGLGAEISYTELDQFLDENGRRAQVSGIARLSALQEGMLFHSLYETGTGNYIEQLCGDLITPDPERFRASWAHLLQRHTALRSAFYHHVFSIPVQVMYRDVTLPVHIYDYRGKDAAAIAQFMAADQREGFDLTIAPLMRVSLLQLNDTQYRMVWTSHHIMLDGWSLPVLVKGLLEIYEQLSRGATVPVTITDDFSTYIHYLEQRDKTAEEQYWRNYLQPLGEGSLLPFITAAHRTKGIGDYREHTVTLDTAFTRRINQFTQQHHITRNTLMQGVWAYLLSRYTGNPDVVYGITVSGRPDDLPGVENGVGLYINTIPLYTHLHIEQGLQEWLQTLQQSQSESRTQQYAGLPDIQRWSGINGELFDSSITFQNYPIDEVLLSGEWQLKLRNISAHPRTNYPLTIVMKMEEQTRMVFTYNSDLLAPAQVVQIATHFEAILQQISAGQAARIRDLSLPGQDRLLQNSCTVVYNPAQTFLHQFRAAVAKNKTGIALVFEGQQMTYEELDNRSNQLAYHLVRRGVTTDTRVILCMERSMEMIIGMLGILKAGGVYVPVEPDLPANRMDYIATDTGARIAVCTDVTLFPSLEHVSPDLSADEITLPEILPDHLLYIIYTSGSTGTPKGVMITHRNLSDYMAGLRAHVPIDECRSFGLLSSIATDLGNTVLFPALTGNTLHLFSKTAVSDAVYLHAYFAKQQIDCIKIVPSHWKALSADDQPLQPARLLIFGGELLSTEITDRIQGCVVVNHYGPTETTIGKLLHVVQPDRVYGHAIPVGKPFSNTDIYVLDSYLRLCPEGVPGELYIGGDGVAQGYLNNPAERFITDPFKSGGRLYRTGDLVKYTPEGELLFLGRADEQVKIRGYRVEPGEISLVLNGCEGVSQGVVIAREGRLLAYVVPEGAFDSEKIYDYLRERLPDYMLPALLIPLTHFPLLANGKIDKRALPEPEAGTGTSYTAPSTQLEEQLVTIWSALLEAETISITDDFFALGGHSLLAIRVISAIRKQLGIEVSIGDIFDYPTIQSLAAQLSARTVSATDTLQRQVRPARIPLSYSQERLWFIDQLEGSAHYHVPAIFRLKGQLDRKALAAAFRNIVSRHEILRTVINQEEGAAYQRVLDKDLWEMRIISDVSYQDEAAWHELISMPFDLSTDHKLRATLIVVSETEHILVITLHHIASDGWSSGIIVKELITLYNTPGTVLPALEMQYADYAIWQRNYLSGNRLRKQLDYWQQQLTGTGILQLPTDYNRPAVQSTRGALSHFHLSKTLLDKLYRLSQAQDATLFMSLLAAFNVLLYRYSGQEDICVGTPVAGRTRQEVEGLVGFFVNTLALRTDLSNRPSFLRLLQRVKENMLQAYAHQEVPFEKVVEQVVKERDVSRNPLFQVAFVLQNMPDIPVLQLGDVVLTAVTPKHTTAKLDLTFTFTETADGLDGMVEYCEDLFNETTIQRMTGCFEQLLHAIVATPEQSIDSLQLLTPSAEKQLLINFNNNAVWYSPDETILGLFAAQVAQRPEAIALIWEDETLSYSELDEHANQLAHYLRKQGVTTEMAVPICIERSFNMIIGILGILKAGGVYVPVDPEYPLARINHIFNDTAATVIVSSSTASGNLPVSTGQRLIELDRVQLTAYEKTTPGNKVIASQLAYIIYTSGSTGTPKGVMIEHGGVVNLALSQAQALRLQPGTRSLQFASFGFDASCYEIFNTLLSGGVLVLPHKEDLLSVDRFSVLLTRHKVELVTLPPSFQHIIKESLSTLKTIVSAGEALNKEDARYIQSQGVRLINAYGPTESTVCASLTDQPFRGEQVVIGEPIANAQLYICGVGGGLVPIGVTGEICIGGAGLARGYLNRPELTREKFIDNPFSPAWGGRLYRTGDLGRWLPDGSIEYLGRLDDQVKIRGYRIELGEIESVLQSSALITQAVVLAFEGRLIAYVVPVDEFDKTATITWLQQVLPEYMIPSLFIPLDKLPLTPSGKIDKQALANSGEAAQQTYTAPRNETEQALCNIWQELLGVETVGIYDDFFELGGDSLLAVRVSAYIKKELGVPVAVGKLFECKNIAKLSEQLTATFDIYEL